MAQLRKVGNSTGLNIPKQVLADAGFSETQAVTLIASPGKIVLAKAEGPYERAMDAYEVCAGRYKNTLTALAK